MSSDKDGWFKRWGKEMPFGPWSYADVEEMMKEMEKDFMELEKALPKHLVRDVEDDGSPKEIGPIVFGYSVTVGPDGKPVVREFGNVRRRSEAEPTETREPLLDIVEGKDEARVIAELPGVSGDDVKLTTKGRVLNISAEAGARKYEKQVELPAGLDSKKMRSSFNNGILEVTFPSKRKARRS